MAGCSTVSFLSLLSQTNLSNCFLLEEILDTGTRYHEGLKVKYGINKIGVEELDKIAEYSLYDLAKQLLSILKKPPMKHWHHK